MDLIKMKERYYLYFTEEESLKAVEQNGCALKYVKEQTEVICNKAVEQTGYALKYVREQTEAICNKAVEQDGYALQYVNESVFKKDTIEVTLEDICNKFGRNVKIIK